MHRRLEELFAAGVAGEEWPTDTDPALAARLFAAGLYGPMAQWHLAPGSFSWPQAAAAVADSHAPACSNTAPARAPTSLVGGRR
jgi:hypothetical protein